LLFFVPLRHPTIMLRKELTEKCLYDETLPGAEDYDFLYQMSEYTKMSNILQPELFSYRRTDQNASSVHSSRDVMLRKSLMGKWFFRKLNIQFDDRELDMLNILGNTAYQEVQPKRIADIMLKLEKLLETIEKKNAELHIYKRDCLLQTLSHRWYREKYKLDSLLHAKIPSDAMKVWRGSKYYSPWF